jgi:DNA-binding transcriptional ArsR family regulator
MKGDADIAKAAMLVASPARAAVLAELMDGRALPPSELAALAGVSRATMSEHLALLERAGFLAVERGGRNRYFRIATPEVADAVEALAAVAPRRKVRSLREANRAGILAAARTCYGHLAGKLGVALADAMQEQGLIAEAGARFELTSTGAERLRRLGIETPPRSGKRCNDWSERRPHLAGPLGVALTKRLFELGWIQRGRAPRSVDLRPEGRSGLSAVFGLEPPDPDGRASR